MKTLREKYIADITEYLERKAFTLANSIECQYIVAVLKEKIDNNQGVAEDDIRVILSENDRLFRM